MKIGKMPIFNIVMKNLVAILLLLSTGLQAQTIEHSFGIDWRTATITITAVYADKYSPLLRANGEKTLDGYIDSFFKTQILELNYDSYRKLKDLALIEPGIMNRLNDLGLRGEKISTKMSKGMDSLEVSYRFRLYPDVIDIFIKHKLPSLPYPLLSFAPSANYSGILIVADGELPVHGEYVNDELQPSLLPKIFDEDMRPIYTYNVAGPQALRKWGPVMFADAIDEDGFINRIGQYPLKVSAIGIFGDNRSDIVLRNGDAERILANEHNINLLRDAKIVIIILPEAE